MTLLVSQLPQRPTRIRERPLYRTNPRKNVQRWINNAPTHHRGSNRRLIPSTNLLPTRLFRSHRLEHVASQTTHRHANFRVTGQITGQFPPHRPSTTPVTRMLTQPLRQHHPEPFRHPQRPQKPVRISQQPVHSIKTRNPGPLIQLRRGPLVPLIPVAQKRLHIPYLTAMRQQPMRDRIPR